MGLGPPMTADESLQSTEKEAADQLGSEQQPGDEAEGYDAYRQYVSIKSHFTSTYDWKKYKGAVSVSRDSYEKRRDKTFFQIIQSKFSPIERNQIFLANFVYNKHLWIGELLSENCISVWYDWQGRLGRMDYQFEEDLKKSIDDIQMRKNIERKECLKFLIRKPEQSHPLVLRFVWGGMFGVESYLLLSSVLNLRKAYQPFLQEDRLWSDFEYKIEKYGNFLGHKLNLEKAKDTLKKITKE